ncbi:MAG: fumarate hydratase [Sphingobacteriales bacterium]|nr:MAG: fumarate hydratase [Sphingobacteriales bacterium]
MPHRKRNFLLLHVVRQLKTFSFLPFISCLLAFLLNACSFNPAIQGSGEAYLQGEWQQDSLSGQKQMITYSLGDFKFDCDSFLITANTVSKIDYGTDSCTKSGRWTEYIKGRYWQNNDTLHVKGMFYNADGSMKNASSCLRKGVYEEFFSVKKRSDSSIVLSGTSSVIPLSLRLVKRTVCKPKPL